MDRYFDKLDERWKSLPLRRQHQYTLYFFIGYLVITAAVVINVFYNTGKSAKDLQIQHIENPVVEKSKSP